MPDRSELSTQPGNPAYGLRQQYEEVKQAESLEALQQLAIELVRPYVNHGMSELEWRKFHRTVTRCRNIQELQAYITNFILKADDDGVLYTARRESIETIADVICENTEFITESRNLIELRKMAGRCGFILVKIA